MATFTDSGAPAGRLAQLATLERSLCREAAQMVARPSLVGLLRAASRFGDWPLSVVTALLLATTFGWRHLAVWTTASLLAVATQKQLKLRCARIRPCQRPDGPPQRAPIPDAGSFPSGHTLHAVMAAVVSAHLLPMLAPGFAALALTIALSRVVLGVHYPSDVAAGGALGALLGAAVVLLL